jgi:hypothetical protein
VQRVGIGPHGTVLHQSIFCERASACRLLAASSRLLTLTDKIAARQLHALKQHYRGKLRLSDVKEMFEQIRDHT